MKKLISTILVLLLFINILNSNVYAGNFKDKFYIEYDGGIFRYNSRIVSLEVDGLPINTGDMPAIIIDNSTLVPVREVFESEAIGAEVVWNGDKKEIYITYKDKLIVLKIDSKIAQVNENQVELDVPAKLIRDINKDYAKTMIPLRFVSENLGFEVEWVEESFTAKLFSEHFVDAGETVDEADSGDDRIDQIDNEDEKLDELGSGKALRELPTPLFNNPIQWKAEIGNIGSEKPQQQELTDEIHDTVKVISVDYSNADGNNKFTINASGPMSIVKISEWDGKYILDIKHALFDLSKESTTYQLSFKDNPIVYSIRSSQQEVDDAGNEVLRIVFDLKNPGANHKLYYNEDRTELIYEMDATNLNGVTMGQNEIGDYIELQGNTYFDVGAFRLSNPDRLVFDLKNTLSLLGYKEQKELDGQYMTTVRTAQFDYQTTRVVVETAGQADYEIKQVDGNKTIIQLIEPSYSNITYDNHDNPKIILADNANQIKADGITYQDNYLEKEFIITLDGNYKDIFGVGEINVNDQAIESVEITEDDNGNTKFIIKEKEIYVFRIEEEDNNIFIKAYKPKEIYSQIIVIDPGHGGKDPGAVANGSQEKDLNLYITMFLKQQLDVDASVKTYYTRLDDSHVSLQARCELANSVEADFFISIHNNAYYSQFNGTETLYFQDEDRPGLNSVELAEILQNNVVNAIGLYNRKKRASNMLYVLKNTDMPAVLLEGGFLTSAIDIQVIKQESAQKNIALAIYKTIKETFAQYPTNR